MHPITRLALVPLVATALACGGAPPCPAPMPVSAEAPAACADTVPGAADAAPTPVGVAHPNLSAVLWTQTAVEFATLTTQTYRSAAVQLERGLADPTWTAAPEQSGDFGALPPAVVMDLDETVLDNSPYQAWMVSSGEGFSPDSWSAWCQAREAGAIPGALEFVRFAVDAGVTVFFVSNREAPDEEATRDNLVALGFGFALRDDLDNVLLKREQDDWGSDKGTRRALIAERFRIVQSIGDNLGDFVDGYRVSPTERDAIVAANDGAWGVRWIVLPNPQYGSWESALFGHDYSRPGAAIDAARLDALEAWSGP